MSNFITTLRGGQLLRVQMVPVLGAADAEKVTGYVLSVENITRNMEQEARRDQILHSLTEGSRAALGNIRAAVTNLVDYPDMEPELRERFLTVVADEVAAMSRRLDETMAESSDSMKMRWPLEDILGIDVIAAAQRRIEETLDLPIKTEELDDALWVKVDSFSLVFALLFLASRLQDHYAPRELRFRLAGRRQARLPRPDLGGPGDVVGDVLHVGDGVDAGGRRDDPALAARRHRPPRRGNLVPAREGCAPRLLPFRAAGGDAGRGGGGRARTRRRPAGVLRLRPVQLRR